MQNLWNVWKDKSNGIKARVREIQVKARNPRSLVLFIATDIPPMGTTSRNSSLITVVAFTGVGGCRCHERQERMSVKVYSPYWFAYGDARPTSIGSLTSTLSPCPPYNRYCYFYCYNYSTDSLRTTFMIDFEKVHRLFQTFFHTFRVSMANR